VKTLIQAAVVMLYAGFSLLVGPLSLWLLLNAITWTGRALALIGWLTLILPASVFLSRRAASTHKLKPAGRRWNRFNLALSLSLTGLIIAVLLTTPKGKPETDSPISHQFTSSSQFRPYHLTNIIPEAEQINLGFTIMPYLDPIFNREQAQRVSGFTLDIYRKMEREPNFRELGTVLGWTYDEVLGQPFDVGHYYLYRPKNHSDGPLPAILFLHGSLGNFKPYVWVWSQLAEEAGVVIIAPSFGSGNWLGPGGPEAALAALSYAENKVDLDSERIYLAGISNGGLGVSKLAEMEAKTFRGLIYLSPVMPADIVMQSSFLDAWRGKPVLIITGQTDRRIPLEYVQQRSRQFTTAGVDVTEIVYPEEDHFLFYAQSEAIIADIAGWLAAQTASSEAR